MTKDELVREAARRGDFYIAVMDDAVDALVEVIIETVAAGEEIKIRNFGIFRPKKYKGYMGKNVKTGEPLEVPERMLPTFKPAEKFKEAMKNKGR